MKNGDTMVSTTFIFMGQKIKTKHYKQESISSCQCFYFKTYLVKFSLYISLRIMSLLILYFKISVCL